ncbi:MAG: aldehyde dehydrogenase (NADP(+)) [Planctomycetota bacterium]|nr:aldehyde dehydrogenase (NADP(+)) [Planctomycetota bacterium]
MQQVLIAGQWRDAQYVSSFRAVNPATREELALEFPVSQWQDCDEALDAAVAASQSLRSISAVQRAEFLEAYATAIEAQAEAIVDMAHLETAYPKETRLAGGELPRTTDQLRQAATAARSESWCIATIDTASGIRSQYGAIGPVAVFGPNNFPLAFGSISGGDFAAAIAAGNPVIAKANSSHPGTTQLFAQCALEAAQATGMPESIIQLIYRTSHEDGERLVADPRLGATGYTGSRDAGLKLKSAADAVGNPIYLELSSVNPVIILPAAMEQRGAEISEEFTSSCLMGTGQFCTNPGLVVMLENEHTDPLIAQICNAFDESPVGTLLSAGVEKSLKQNLQVLVDAGAERLAGHSESDSDRFCQPNTLLKISAKQFIADPETMQTEAFGNSSLLVVAESIDEVSQLISCLEGNLTGCIYSATDGADDDDYDRIAPELQVKVGRLLNDKMPTGVAVSAAMNHGGPFPATGHPGFTAVGIPGSLLRFAMLQCYDNIRQDRLPTTLHDSNPNGEMWRCVDGNWTQGNVS